MDEATRNLLLLIGTTAITCIGVIIKMWAENSKVRAESKKALAEAQRIREESKREQANDHSDIQKMLITSINRFADESKETRGVQQKSSEVLGQVGELLKGLTAKQEESIASVSTLAERVTALRIEAEQRRAEYMQAIHDTGLRVETAVEKVGTNITERFDQQSESLIKISGELTAVLKSVQHFNDTFASSHIDILLELKAVSEHQITVGEQLVNAGSKLLRLEEMAARLQTVVESVVESVNRAIQSGSTSSPPLVPPDDVPVDDEDTIKLEITKAGIEPAAPPTVAAAEEAKALLSVREEPTKPAPPPTSPLVPPAPKKLASGSGGNVLP